MGNAFRSSISVIEHQQQEWVPREPDINGGGQQGTRLVASPYLESVLFDNLAITDTLAHMSNPPSGENPTGVPFDQVYAVYKTALITSTLNESVSLQPMWSRDRVNWYPFSNAVSLSAYSGTGNPQTTAFALSTPSLYIPYVGVQATCSTAPTSGNLNGWLERLG